MTVQDAIYRPHSVNRYLSRPILNWTVEGDSRILVGDENWNESIGHLLTDGFNWGIYPDEWRSNTIFSEFIEDQKKKTEDILNSEVKSILEKGQILFDSSVKNLKRANNQNLGIDNMYCGEIDFLFMLGNVVYIGECKHLRGRYDSNNSRVDFSNFVNPKGFENVLERKIRFLNENIDDVREHFVQLTGNETIRNSIIEVDGIFIINTPTIYMYGSKYRIFTLKWFKDLTKGVFKDKTYRITKTDREGITRRMEVKYPYFDRPKYLVE